MAMHGWSWLVRRWWAAALLLITLITACALVWSASPASPHTYTATRTLRIIVLPGDGAGAYGASMAQASEAAIAGELADSSLLSSPAFAAAVVGQLAGTSAFTAPGGHLTASMVRQALSASHSGGDVTLSASWDSADGATALADAAVRELGAEAVASGLPGGASLRIVEEGVGAPAQRDTGAEAARSTDILVRGGLAALAVFIVAGALVAVKTSGQHGERENGRELEGSALDPVG